MKGKGGTMGLLGEVIGLVLCGAGLFVLGWLDGRSREKARWRNVAEWYRQESANENRRRQSRDLSVN